MEEEYFYEEEKEDTFYTEERVFGLLEDDEISIEEEGFMIGYMGA